MAGVTRIISTKLVLDGEKEYQSALKSINAEQRAYNSELKQLESQFKGAANSLEALTAKGEAYQRILDLQNKKLETVSEHLEKAKKAYADFADAGSKVEAELKQNEAALGALDASTRKSGEEWAKYAKQVEQSQGKLKSLQNSSEDTSAEQEKLAAKIAKAQESMQKLETSTGGAAKTAGELVQENARLNAEWEKAQGKTQGAADKINQLQSEYNKTKTAVNETNGAIKQNSKYVDEAKNSFDGTTPSLDEFGNKVDKSKQAIDALSSALAAAGVIAGLKKIAEALQEAIAASIEFESAITGVYKTVDGTDEQLRAISDGIKQLSTVIPASTTELAAVAEAAGQLGIATDDILGFTEVMTNLGVTTNLSATEAAKALARFANITGTSSQDYERLGSSVVALGNNFATTESEIVLMSTRLASAGTLAGLTEAEIFALATAMSSVGIQAEAGGTAMTQTMTAIEKAVAKGGKDLEQFAKVAGMSSTDFSKAWKDEPIIAIQAFIAGLGELEAQGESATLFLDEMGLSGIRQSNMLRSLSLASNELVKAVELSSIAWAENTALTDEASLRYGTLESRLQLLDNSVALLKQSVGDALAPALGELVEVGTDVTQWAAEFIADNEGLVQGVTILTATLGVFVGGAVGLAGLLKVLPLIKTAIIGVNAAMAANPIGAAIVALAAITTAVIGLIAVLKKTSPEVEAVREEFEKTKKANEDFTKSIESEKAQVDILAGSLQKLTSTSDGSAASQLAIKNVTKELVALVPELTNYLNEETGALEGNWQEAAKAAAERRSYAEALEYEASISAQVEGTKAKLAEVEAELLQLEADGVSVIQDKTSLYSSYSQGLDENRERYNELKATQRGYIDSLEEMGEELSLAEIAVLGFKEIFGEQTEEIDAATGAIQGIVDEMKALEAEYEEAYQAAKSSFEGQFDLWEVAPGIVAKSVAEMNAGLASQEDYWKSYADNVNSLMGRNVEGLEILVAKYSDGSKVSAEAIAGLAGATDAELRAVVAQLEATQAAQDAAAEASALAKVDFDSRADELAKRAGELVDDFDLSSDMVDSGEKTIQGYINGIDRKSGALYIKMQAVANTVIARWRAALDERSPSRKFRESGANSMQGYIMGVESKQSEINAVMKRAAELAVESFGKGFEKTAELAKKAMEEYQRYADEIAASMQGALDEMQGRIDDITKQQEAMASKLADYGDLMRKASISWSDGSKTEYSELSNLQSQINVLEEYGRTLDALKERGLSDGLMLEVTSMSVDEAIEYGRLLLQQSDKQWEDYNAKYEEKQRLAKEIAEKFYKDELDLLEGEYADKLQESLGVLHHLAYNSGEDTVRGLIEGMKAQEAALQAQAQRIAAIAASAASSSVDGSHAGGLPFVPFDGYRAELHFGERVLTAEEAQEYAQRSIPSVLEPPRQVSRGDEQTAAIVNALSTLTAGVPGESAPGDLTIVVNQDSVEFYRITLPAFRQVQSENPIEVNDF